MPALLVPYGPVARRGFGRYRFLPGSLRWAGPLPLLVDHDRSQRVGTVAALTDTPAALLAWLRVRPGVRGDRALALGGLSVRVDFDEVTRDPHRRGVTLVHRARLREVSLTASPAFDTARLTRQP